MQTLGFRAATEADIPFLLGLRRTTMTRHQLASGVAPSEDAHLQRVRVHFDCAQIVLVDGAPAGLLKVYRDGPDWELVQIQLLASMHGRGLGTRLLAPLIAEARAAGARLRLRVLRANPARRLYERMGFAVDSASDTHFEMLLGT